MGFTDEVPDIPDTAASTDPLDTYLVRKALAGLKPEYRKVLLLSYYQGYTQAELSKVMDVPLGTIKSWLRRGLIELREVMT